MSCFSGHIIYDAQLYQLVKTKECLLFLIIFEALLCSVFFLLVLTLRLRYTDLALKMDYMIRIMNIFNSKEEELNNAFINEIDRTESVTKRMVRLSKKIDDAILGATNLLKEIDPIVTLMSIYRTAGITLFYLILATSGLYFSPIISIVILLY